MWYNGTLQTRPDRWESISGPFRVTAIRTKPSFCDNNKPLLSIWSLLCVLTLCRGGLRSCSRHLSACSRVAAGPRRSSDSDAGGNDAKKLDGEIPWRCVLGYCRPVVRKEWLKMTIRKMQHSGWWNSRGLIRILGFPKAWATVALGLLFEYFVTVTSQSTQFIGAHFGFAAGYLDLATRPVIRFSSESCFRMMGSESTLFFQ